MKIFGEIIHEEDEKSSVVVDQLVIETVLSAISEPGFEASDSISEAEVINKCCIFSSISGVNAIMPSPPES